MDVLKLRFHNWRSRQMCHMGRVVSSQLVVLLAISTVAGEKTQKMKCMNPTAHKATLSTEEFQVRFLIQLKCSTFCPEYVCSVTDGSHISHCVLCCLTHTFHDVFYAVGVSCFILFFFSCHYEKDWNKPLDDRMCLFPSDRFVRCISHGNMAISVVWGLLIGRE
jgi:hypothetical protein